MRKVPLVPIPRGNHLFSCTLRSDSRHYLVIRVLKQLWQKQNYGRFTEVCSSSILGKPFPNLKLNMIFYIPPYMQDFKTAIQTINFIHFKYTIKLVLVNVLVVQLSPKSSLQSFSPTVSSRSFIVCISHLDLQTTLS